MKKRSVGVMLVLLVVLVLSLGVAAGASAGPFDPSISSVSPSSMSNDTWGNQDLVIYGSNLDAFIGDPTITLYQTVSPFDVINGTYNWTATDAIYCSVNTYLESAGQYTVELSGIWRIGQYYDESVYLTNGFRVTGTPPVSNNPVVASISPKSKDAGSGGFLMTVYGSNFASGGVGLTSTVYWNDTALETNVTSAGTVLSAAVPASLVANPGVASIKVRNTIPGQSVTISNAVSFTITALQPTLTSVSPTSGFAKYYQPYQLQLTGTNFQNTSQVLVNGVVHAATYVSPTQLTMQLTAADIASPGTLNISVRNGTSGTPTNTVAFTLTADTTAPVTTISGADTNWHNTPVTLTVSVTDVGGPGVQTTYYGIGIPPSIALVGGTITVPAGSGSPQGPQLVQAYSMDKCGNNEVPPAAVTVNICSTGPSTSCIAPASVKKGKTLKIKWEADSITPKITATMKIYKSSNNTVAKSFNLGTQDSNKTFTKSFTCNLSPGKYKVKVFATDAAGNPQSQQDSDSFSVTK